MGIKSLKLVRILLYSMQMIVSSKSVSNIRVKGKEILSLNTERYFSSLGDQANSNEDIEMVNE